MEDQHLKIKEPSGNESIRPAPELTFGMKLVGIDFNPSFNPDVDRIKRLAAEMADILDHLRHKQPTTELHDQIYKHAITEILNAQMNAVKAITFNF